MNAVISGRAGMALLIDGESLMSLDVDDLETLVPRSPYDLRFLLADVTDLVTLENTDRDQVAERLDLEHDIACALDMTLIALDPDTSMELRAEAAEALDELLADPRVIERLEFTMYAKPLPEAADLIGALFCIDGKTEAARSFLERLERSQTAIAAVREAWNALPDHLFGDEPAAKALFHDAAYREGLFRLLASSYGDQAKVSASLIEALQNRSISGLRNYRQVFQTWSAPIHAAASTPTQVNARQYAGHYEGPTRAPHRSDMKILFLAANPVDVVTRLRIDKEIREISQKIRVGPLRDHLQLVSEWAVRADDLQDLLMKHQPDIVHFSGHCSPSSGIMLEDECGNRKVVNRDALADLFRLLKGNIRLVVLNACYAKDQAEALATTVDFTIGMNAAIGYKDATIFAARFYESLAFGYPVKEAFELAVNQLRLVSSDVALVPELLEREGANAAESRIVEPTRLP